MKLNHFNSAFNVLFKSFIIVLIANFIIHSNSIAATKKQTIKSTIKKESTPPPISFESWLETPAVKAFQAKASLAGVPETFSTELLKKAMMQPIVKRYMDPAPSQTRKNWAAYKARFTDKLRIQKGLAFLDSYESTFKRAETEYGVPAPIIASIIGIETLYGTYTGNFKLIDVLTTLAFDYPRRAEYFQGELLAFMQLVQAKTIPEDIRGSFAGALGLPQFMPSSLQKYAISSNNQPQIDLVNHPEDAIMSVASFLSKHGWQKGLPVAFEADGFDESNSGAFLQTDATPLYDYSNIAPFAPFAVNSVPKDTKFAVIELQYIDLSYDYLLTTHNFHMLMQYNRSYFYASSVWYLAKKLGL